MYVGSCYLLRNAALQWLFSIMAKLEIAKTSFWKFNNLFCNLILEKMGVQELYYRWRQWFFTFANHFISEGKKVTIANGSFLPLQVCHNRKNYFCILFKCHPAGREVAEIGQIETWHNCWCKSFSSSPTQVIITFSEIL